MCASACARGHQKLARRKAALAQRPPAGLHQYHVSREGEQAGLLAGRQAGLLAGWLAGRLLVAAASWTTVNGCELRSLDEDEQLAGRSESCARFQLGPPARSADWLAGTFLPRLLLPSNSVAVLLGAHYLPPRRRHTHTTVPAEAGVSRV